MTAVPAGTAHLSHIAGQAHGQHPTVRSFPGKSGRVLKEYFLQPIRFDIRNRAVKRSARFAAHMAKEVLMNAGEVCNRKVIVAEPGLL
jgi:hypothetical protein